MAATTPRATAPAGDRSVDQDHTQSFDVGHQRRTLEEKFAQIQRERREAQALKREVEQTQTNTKTDEQIMLLMQADECLASLLSQAADSMCALLPSEARQGRQGSSDGLPLYGAKAFEERVQGWFVILNEVQYTLRFAMRHLRDAQRVPLTPPCGPEARQTGLAGSASRGHSLSLMEAFVDTSGSDGTVFKLPPLPRKTPATLSLPQSETSLSLSALRRKEKNWQSISQSLEEVEKTLAQDEVKAEAGQASNLTDSALLEKKTEHEIVDAIRTGANTDKLLLQALLQTNGLA